MIGYAVELICEDHTGHAIANNVKTSVSFPLLRFRIEGNVLGFIATCKDIRMAL